MATAEAEEQRCEAQVCDEQECYILLRVGMTGSQDLSEVLTLSVCVTVSGTHKEIPCSLNRREESSDFRYAQALFNAREVLRLKLIC